MERRRQQIWQRTFARFDTLDTRIDPIAGQGRSCGPITCRRWFRSADLVRGRMAGVSRPAVALELWRGVGLAGGGLCRGGLGAGVLMAAAARPVPCDGGPPPGAGR